MFEGRSALLDAIRLGETTFLEFKEVRFSGGKVMGPRRDALANELAAFANRRGGVLVLGVDDDREIVGIPADRLRRVVEYVREVCAASVAPALAPIVDVVHLPSETGEERAVVKVEIERSMFVHGSPGGYYHRVADAKRMMFPDYLARLFQQRAQTGLIRFDEQIVSDASLDALRPEPGPLTSK